jgi:KDO2-lipid IV(A) lauroyltransferase
MSARPPRLADRIEDAALGAALAGAGLLGARAAAGVGARIGRLGYRPLGIRRAQVESNLRIAFPDRDPAWIRGTAAAAYAHIGREAVRTLLAARHPGVVPGPVRIDGAEVLRAGIAAGRGVVLVGGHLGNWELGVGALATSGFPVTAVVRRQRNPLFDRRILGIRRGFGFQVIDRGHATRPALEALGRNRIVVLIADQDARRTGIFVPFFNRLASTPRGPAVLTHRAGAALAFFSPIRRPDGTLEVRIEALDVERSGAAEDIALRITATYVARLEQAVRAAPEQYLWHHRRWKTLPPEPSAAGAAPTQRP